MGRANTVVADQDIDVTKVGFGSPHRLLTTFRRSQIRDDERVAGIAQLADVPCHTHDICATSGEQIGGDTPYPATTSGDQRISALYSRHLRHSPVVGFDNRMANKPVCGNSELSGPLAGRKLLAASLADAIRSRA